MRHVPAPILPSNAEGESHSVSHLPLRSWCSACVREAEQIPTVSVDYMFFGQLEDRAHDTLPVLIVRDRKGKGIWSRPVPSKGVTHPHPVRALMADLDFMDCRRVILKSDQALGVPYRRFLCLKSCPFSCLISCPSFFLLFFFSFFFFCFFLLPGLVPFFFSVFSLA